MSQEYKHFADERSVSLHASRFNDFIDTNGVTLENLFSLALSGGDYVDRPGAEGFVRLWKGKGSLGAPISAVSYVHGKSRESEDDFKLEIHEQRRHCYGKIILRRDSDFLDDLLRERGYNVPLSSPFAERVTESPVLSYKDVLDYFRDELNALSQPLNQPVTS